MNEKEKMLAEKIYDKSDDCVLGAGSVVTRDISANSLAVDTPCRIIKQSTDKDDLEIIIK